MIPTLGQVVAGYRFVAERWKRSGELNEGVVRLALRDAAALADGVEKAEPAALFYAFARRPRAFPGSWRLMPALLAVNQAHSLGYRLRTDAAPLNNLLVSIASRRLDFGEVLAWFDSHLQPIAPSPPSQ